jgi:AcrR family transcriptional regulator
MKDTKDRIFEKALQLFNDKGIEYVGMRELAEALDMRIGNITYYYPTKDDLVYAISVAYSELNNKVHKEHGIRSLHDLLSKYRQLFRNGIEYKALMLSMVHIMERNPLVAENYAGVGKSRMMSLNRDISSVAEAGYLKFGSEDDLWFLVSSMSLIARFWMSEASLSVKRQSMDRQMGHYLKLLAHLFRPYATRKGLKDIDVFLEEL